MASLSKDSQWYECPDGHPNELDECGAEYVSHAVCKECGKDVEYVSENEEVPIEGGGLKCTEAPDDEFQTREEQLARYE